MYDIGIIGGGTAGMTAAIYGQRAGKKTIIIEGSVFGGQITSSPNVENYPGIASVSGSEFSMNLLDQAVKLGAETAMEQVTGIRDEGSVKVIETAGKEYPCRSVILATGVTHRHLGVPNEERLTGAGVSYCATCDGMFFRGRDVAVVGGGSTALQDAEFLSDYCRKVYLIHRRDPYRPGYFDDLTKQEAYEEYLEVILENIRSFPMFDVLAHIDYIVRNSPYPDPALYYREFSDHIDEILKFLIETGHGLEMNTSSYSIVKFDGEIMKRYKELGGEIVTIGSDAHTPDGVGKGSAAACALLKDAGFRYFATYEKRKAVFHTL